MKKLILLTAFICLFLTPTFSQINGHFKIDTIFRDRSIFSYQKPLKLSDSIDIKSLLKGPLNIRPLCFPKFSERNFDIRPKSMWSIAQSQFHDKMPCVRPEGYFPIPIVKPDSTVRYSLLIKRY